MTAVDPENLARRMRRITEMTKMLLAEQADPDYTHTLAEHVGHEIAVARLQIRLYTPHNGIPRVRGFGQLARARRVDAA